MLRSQYVPKVTPSPKSCDGAGALALHSMLMSLRRNDLPFFSGTQSHMCRIVLEVDG